MEWRTIGRPGQYGKKRDEAITRYNADYGAGNWRLAWQWGEPVIAGDMARQIYEDAYYADSIRREDLWLNLAATARDVYDQNESDVGSGLDYLIQQSNQTHLQDISIRRVFVRRGWQFNGDKLIQIRSHKSQWGALLSPGRVPFHMPNAIVVPHLQSWWDKDSIEDVYQSNKLLQVKA